MNPLSQPSEKTSSPETIPLEQEYLSFSPLFFTLLLLTHVLCGLLALPLIGWKWLVVPSLAAISFTVLPRELPGRRPYLKLWFFGTLFWLYVSHIVRYPHWINYFLWFALASYLGMYLPIFAALSRTLIHDRLPRFFRPILGEKVSGSAFRTFSILFSVSMIWAGCDVLRGWIFSGFMLGSVSDAFYRDPLFIQTADLVGQWGTSALFLCLSTALGLTLFPFLQYYFPRQILIEKASGETSAIPSSFLLNLKRQSVWSFCAFFLGSTFLLGYGFWRLNQENPNQPVGNFALLQGNVPSELTTSPELIAQTEACYLKLAEEVRTGTETQAIRNAGEKIDLVVFPECIYRQQIIFSEKNAFQPQNLMHPDGTPIDSEFFQKWIAETAAQSQNELLAFSRYVIQAPFLTGATTFYYSEKRIHSWNSAFFVTPEAQSVQRKDAYHKMILVPFGEYVPTVKTLRQWFPNIDSYLPISSQDSGTEPVAIPIQLENGETLHASLSICFESVLARLIRRQIANLREKGTEPDLLINLANNGWFHYSHETELHLACGVFRAIENRKPLLTAANWGITASTDSCGKILEEIPTGEAGVLLTKIQKDPRRTLFTAWGGVFLWIPLLFMLCGMPFPKEKQKAENQKLSKKDFPKKKSI